MLLTGIANAFDFSSRACRQEFLSVIGAYIVFVFIIAPWLDAALYASKQVPPFKALSLLLLTLPVISVSTRRLHDHNISGKWTLTFLIGGIGFVLFLPLLLSHGQEETNKYGKPTQ